MASSTESLKMATDSGRNIQECYIFDKLCTLLLMDLILRSSCKVSDIGVRFYQNMHFLVRFTNHKSPIQNLIQIHQVGAKMYE
jgi:hypothetical protein